MSSEKIFTSSSELDKEVVAILIEKAGGDVNEFRGAYLEAFNFDPKIFTEKKLLDAGIDPNKYIPIN